MKGKEKIFLVYKNSGEVLSKLKSSGIRATSSSTYEVCPKSLWTTLSKVLDKHISLKAYVFHKVQHQLN